MRQLVQHFRNHRQAAFAHDGLAGRKPNLRQTDGELEHFVHGPMVGQLPLDDECIGDLPQGTLAVESWKGLPGSGSAPAYSAMLPLIALTGHPLGGGQAPPSEKITGP